MLQFVQKARGYISGHVTKKPVMNNGASGKSFCTVLLAVNLPPYAGKDGTKIVPEPMFYELTAFGSTAEHICRDVEKGHRFECEFNIRPQKPRKVEKDGVVTVYNDWSFVIVPFTYSNIPEPPKSDTKNQATREATVPNENTAAPAPTAAEAVSAPMQTSHDPMRDFEKAEEGFTVPEQATDDESSFAKLIQDSLPY